MRTKFNRRAFTLVELLIVIAIIGILFVILVSKVDFATDKANTTGVQTDFRSFQIAFETVSRENAGFNTLGWDTGDNAGGIAKDGPVTIGGIDYTYANADKDAGDRVRNSYDVGDLNLNGICEDGETWTGQKLYTEIWTGIYTLDNPADATDMSAYLALEKALNKNLDPALQISIDPENKTIYMANGYQDPWKTEYHGFYLTNAAVDGKDRGAIVMYSDGPNKVFGSKQTIANGAVTIGIWGNNINGQDDMSIVTCYSYINGYGENTTITSGFSNNQVLSGSGNGGAVVIPIPRKEYIFSGNEEPIRLIQDVSVYSNAPVNTFKDVKINGVVVDPINYTVTEGSTVITFKSSYIATLENGTLEVEIISNDGDAKGNIVKKVLVPGLYITGTETMKMSWDELKTNVFSNNVVPLSNRDLLEGDLILPDNQTSIAGSAFLNCEKLTSVICLGKITSIGTNPFAACYNLEKVEFVNNKSYYEVKGNCIINKNTKAIIAAFNAPVIPTDPDITKIEARAFWGAKNVETLYIPANIIQLVENPFGDCDIQTLIVDENNPVYRSYNNCLIEKETNTMICGNSSITVIDESFGITTIAKHAFWGSKIKKLSFTNYQELDIQSDAFEYCPFLRKIYTNSVYETGQPSTFPYKNNSQSVSIDFNRSPSQGSSIICYIPSYIPYK